MEKQGNEIVKVKVKVKVNEIDKIDKIAGLTETERHTLTESQQKAFIAMKQNLNVFVTGSGGVGKSYLINFFKTQMKRNVALTSLTGVSALLIGGKTIHSWAGINLGHGTVEKLYSNMYPTAKKNWRMTDTLVIDEISMMPPTLLIKLEELARMVRQSEEIFGGLQVIFVGDFAQLPPVRTKKFCFEIPLWNEIIDVSVHLTEIIRQSDIHFQEILTEIRYGLISKHTKKELKKRLISGDLPKINGIEPTMLYAKNIDVNTKNTMEIDKLKNSGKKSQKYFSSVTVQTNMDISLKLEERLKDKLRKLCPALEMLELTIDSQVMILKNLDLDNGIANGTRGVVVDLDINSVLVRILSGKLIRIEKATWELKTEDNIEIKLIQMPLIPAWSLSIHKTQGSTLDLVAMDLGDSIFEYGQAYVALSRVKSLEGLYLTKLKTSAIKCHPKVFEFYRNEFK